jgi:uncharacterized membrane protein YqjE
MQIFAGIKAKLLEYVDTKLQLFQIDIEERISDFLSNLVYLILVAVVLLFGLFFLLFFIAKIINDLTQSHYLGYGIMSILFILLFFILNKEESQLVISEKIKKRIILKSKQQKDGNQESRSI